MRCFSFEVIVNEEISQELTEALFEAGCDDAGIGCSGGVWSVHFDREAGSLVQAFRSAAQQIRSVGLTIRRMSIEEADLEAAVQETA